MAGRRRLDLTGMKFGKWTVIKASDEQTKIGHSVMWDCVCECGYEKSVDGYLLRKGKSRSCGCCRGNYVIKRTEAYAESLFDEYLGNGTIKPTDYRQLTETVISALKNSPEDAADEILDIMAGYAYLPQKTAFIAGYKAACNL